MKRETLNKATELLAKMNRTTEGCKALLDTINTWNACEKEKEEYKRIVNEAFTKRYDALENELELI